MTVPATPAAPQAPGPSTGGPVTLTATIGVWIARLILIAAAVAGVWGAQHEYADFQGKLAQTLRFDWGGWAVAMGLLAVAGAAFTLSGRLPLDRPRYAWGWLAIAVILSALLVHFPVALQGWGAWLPLALRTPRWFDGLMPQAALALLTGVALASGIVTQNEA